MFLHLFLALTAIPLFNSLTYECNDNQILVVQSFGNDTIRMHCQRLNLCGFEHLKCEYDELQPSCGGQTNFVASVNQFDNTGPVEHKCCNLFNPNEPLSIPSHTGNDCFIYDLPDGSKDITVSPQDDTPFAILKSVSDIPEQFDGYTGYRLRLFLLKNKSPPILLVKGIQRRLNGYRVTICRPQCIPISSQNNEGDTNQRWKALHWSSWSSNSWSSWQRTRNENKVEESRRESRERSDDRNGLIGGIIGDRLGGVNSNGNGIGGGIGSSSSSASSSSSSNSSIGGRDSNINIHIHTQGDKDKNGDKDVRDEDDGDKKRKEEEDERKRKEEEEDRKRKEEEEERKRKEEEADRKRKEEDEERKREEEDEEAERKRREKEAEDDRRRRDEEEREKLRREEEEARRLRIEKEKENEEILMKERKRLEEEMKKLEEERRKNKEREERLERLEKERREEDERRRIEDEKKKEIDEILRKEKEEEEEERIRKIKEQKEREEEEKKRIEEEKRKDEEKKFEEERIKNIEEKKKIEEEKRLEEEKKIIELEKKRIEEEVEKLKKEREDGERKEKEEKERLEKEEIERIRKEEENRKEKEERERIIKEDEERRRKIEEEAEEIRKEEEEEEKRKKNRREGSNEIENIIGKEDIINGNKGSTAGGTKSEEDIEQTENKIKTTQITKDTTDKEEIVLTEDKVKNRGNGIKTRIGEEDIVQKEEIIKTNHREIPESEEGEEDEEDEEDDEDKDIKGARPKITGKGNGEGLTRYKVRTGKGGTTVQINGEANGGGVQQNNPTEENPIADVNPSNSLMSAMRSMNCFSADSLVATINGERKMADLQVGDYVLVPSAENVLKYERVEMFYHREEDTTVQFKVIRTENGRTLTMTPYHLIPFGECQHMNKLIESGEGIEEAIVSSRFAYKVQVGDCVLSISNNGQMISDRVVEIGSRISKGIYSPMTVEGSVIVDGVLVSCFSHLESHSMHKIIFDILIRLYDFFYLSTIPSSSSLGIPSFISALHSISHFILPFAS